MKVLDELIKKIPERANNYCKRIANSIERKTTINIKNAVPYLSDLIDYPITYIVNESTKETSSYTINVIGSQLAFLEFGTGIYNQPYLMGAGGYAPDIVSKTSIAASRGLYGKGKGERYWWIFNARYSGNVGIRDAEFVPPEPSKEHHYYGDKRLINTSGNKNAKKIITKGIPPQRMVYRAVQETIKELEVAKKKWL